MVYLNSGQEKEEEPLMSGEVGGQRATTSLKCDLFFKLKGGESRRNVEQNGASVLPEERCRHVGRFNLHCFLRDTAASRATPPIPALSFVHAEVASPFSTNTCS